MFFVEASINALHLEAWEAPNKLFLVSDWIKYKQLWQRLLFFKTWKMKICLSQGVRYHLFQYVLTMFVNISTD